MACARLRGPGAVLPLLQRFSTCLASAPASVFIRMDALFAKKCSREVWDYQSTFDAIRICSAMPIVRSCPHYLREASLRVYQSWATCCYAMDHTEWTTLMMLDSNLGYRVFRRLFCRRDSLHNVIVLVMVKYLCGNFPERKTGFKDDHLRRIM